MTTNRADKVALIHFQCQGAKTQRKAVLNCGFAPSQCYLTTSSHSAKIFFEEARKPRTIGKNFWFPGFLMELILGAASLRCSAIRQNHHKPRRFFKATTAGLCSAGFLTCCIADFPVGRTLAVVQSAGLETRDTADLEVCATGVAALR
jgi:hypothetical protein